jgi:hypothetical protein
MKLRASSRVGRCSAQAEVASENISATQNHGRLVTIFKERLINSFGFAEMAV